MAEAETKEAKVPQVQEPNPYYNALLSLIAVVQELGSCDDESLRACLESEGIGDFYEYAQILVDAGSDDPIEEPEDDANPAQENDEPEDHDDEAIFESGEAEAEG